MTVRPEAASRYPRQRTRACSRFHRGAPIEPSPSTPQSPDEQPEPPIVPLPPLSLVAARGAARGAVRGLFWEPPPEFHAALCTYVGDLRAAGLGPVQVRLTVMRAVPDVSPILLERSVARCAEAYDRPR